MLIANLNHHIVTKGNETAKVLCDLHFSYACIDNVLIANSNPQEHKQHLKQVFDCYKQFGVIVNPTKCQFGVNELTFLGHSLNHQGMLPLQDKVKAIQLRVPTA